jgi:hypothetical protein
MYAVGSAFRRLDQLSRFFSDDVDMFYDPPMAVRSLLGFQLQQHSIVGGISLVAEQNNISFCVVVSKMLAPMAGLLPWKARAR